MRLSLRILILVSGPVWFGALLSSSDEMRGIRSQTSVTAGDPPAVLYHFGRRAHMIADARADTIPQEAWDQFVVGTATTFKSHPFRRGLYGTTHPAFADNFGEWFVAVHVREECRQPDAVVTPSDLLQDQRFNRWMVQRGPESGLAAFASQCFRPSTALEADSPRSLLQVDNLPASGAPAGVCEVLLDRFYTDTGAKTILDEQWLEQQHIGVNLLNRISWYIRDRSCIEAIDGDEADVVAMMAAVPALWDDQDFLQIATESPERVRATRAIGYAHTIRMLLIGLATSPASATEADLLKLRAMSEEGYAPLSPLTLAARDVVPTIIDAFRRCRAQSDSEAFRRAVPTSDQDAAAIPDLVARLRMVCVRGRDRQ